MLIILNEINSTFFNINHAYVNSFSNIKIRNRQLGIALKNILLFRFKYSYLHTTQEKIICDINFKNNTNHDRTCFIKKESNIHKNLYNELSKKIYEICNNYINENKNIRKLVAIDGTCSNTILQKVALNMGYYDITTRLVLDLTFNGHENRNKEVKSLMKHIKENKDMFANVTIVGDRAYFTYELLKYLIDHDIKYIIRCKGKGTNLNIGILLKTKNKDIIEFVRNNSKVFTYSEVFSKTIWSRSTKIVNEKQHILEVMNDCVIVTNLHNETKEKILEIYRSRWSIETFFKIIKENFKIQHTKERNTDHCQKILCCTSIIMNIVTLLEYIYTKDNKYKINRSLLIHCIYEHLLEKIVCGNLQIEVIIKIKCYIKLVKNKNDRTFPRISNTPFSKWNSKSYSIHAEMNKIINAILNDTVASLHKNKKLLAKHILTIKNKYGDILKVNNK